MPDFKARVQALIASLHLLPKGKRMAALKAGIEKFPDNEKEAAMLLVAVAVEITEEYMKTWEKITMISAGAFFMVTLLVIALAVPNPTTSQFFFFRIVLASAAAAFGVGLPGNLGVNVGVAKAGGALGLFLLVYYVNPPALISAH